MARLLSVNVGLPRDIEWQGKTVHTAVWKTPVRQAEATTRRASAFEALDAWPSKLLVHYLVGNKVRSCAGFRTPAMTSRATRSEAGVGKAPRHEIAGR
jgi:hypothetical protein